MRILIISNLFPPDVLGGYELGCADVAMALAERGHEITVLTSRNSATPPSSANFAVKRHLRLSDIYDGRIDGTVLRASNLFYGAVIDLFNVATLLNELTGKEYDVIYTFNLLGLGAIALCDILAELNVPWVWHLGDAVPAIMLSGVRPEIGALFEVYSTRLNKASRTLVVSDNLVREISDCGFELGTNVVIVPGWASHCPPDARPRPTSETLRFVSIGTVCEAKGTGLIIRALSMLDEGERAQVAVEFFGQGDLDSYQRDAERLGVAGSVTFRGQLRRDSVLRMLPAFDGLLFPTAAREPFGVVALEAAACGVAPIITRGIGAAEVLKDGIHAIHIERSEAAIVGAFRKALNDRQWLATIGESARPFVKELYSLGRIVDVIERELRSVGMRFVLRREDAERIFCENRFKYDIAKTSVSSAPADGGAKDILITEKMAAYFRLKKAGRGASTSFVVKLLRSGLMRLLRPYLLEMIEWHQELQRNVGFWEARLGELEAKTARKRSDIGSKIDKDAAQ